MPASDANALERLAKSQNSFMAKCDDILIFSQFCLKTHRDHFIATKTRAEKLPIVANEPNKDYQNRIIDDVLGEEFLGKMWRDLQAIWLKKIR